MIYIKITPLIIRNSKVHKEKTRNTNLPKRWMKLFPIQWIFAGIFAVKAARITRKVSRGIRQKQTHCACRRLLLNIFVSAYPTWRSKMAPWQQNFNPPLLKNHNKSEPQIWEFLLLTFNLLYDKNEGKLCFYVQAFRNTLSYRKHKNMIYMIIIKQEGMVSTRSTPASFPPVTVK